MINKEKINDLYDIRDYGEYTGGMLVDEFICLIISEFKEHGYSKTLENFNHEIIRIYKRPSSHNLMRMTQLTAMFILHDISRKLMIEDRKSDFFNNKNAKKRYKNEGCGFIMSLPYDSSTSSSIYGRYRCVDDE